MSEFPERLRKLRERKRLKRYVLSERCGLNSDAIRRYELGTAKPTMDALKSIADEFGVSVDYLMGRTDYPCVVDLAENALYHGRCRGKLCISILFLFPLLFLMGGASAPPGGSNMQAEAGWIQLKYNNFWFVGSNPTACTKSGGHYRWAMA